MKKVVPVAVIVLLTGCAYNIPSYQPGDENLSLISAGTRPIHVIYEAPSFDDDGSIVCRAAGAVKLPDGQMFSHYITDALKNELKSKHLFSESSDSKLTVSVQRVDFSSQLGATNWYIDTDFKLDGDKFSVSTVYNDRSSYVAVKACNNMALYFRSAVAEHLRQLYRQEPFKRAIGVPGEAEATKSPGLRERLERLENIYHDGLITKEEYNTKRQEILDEL